ncbi:response regulator [Aeromonas salmonicida]|uniref:response regulator n=1 Tax=Aeromonas salmonicida TaxID=645 RepID=UPI000B617E09|nr:response regulator [Aeromonas salmonicida]ARW81935.1 hypothetical protein O23A_p1190 [Aeromonas salmonicida]
MKILIIDDNSNRTKEISSLLLDNLICPLSNITVCDRTSVARKPLRESYFDILILDVVIPDGSEQASASTGLRFLNEIARKSEMKKSPNRIIKPGVIIGITAHEEDISKFREQFNKYCFNIIEAAAKNNLWKQQLLNAFTYAKSRSIEKIAAENKTTCVTVHGIETRGTWQDDFKGIILTHTNLIEFETYKYGIYPFLSFLIPFARNLEVYRFKHALNYILDNNERVIIFSHSFGTYVTIKALEGIEDEKLKKIKYLVLAGSVLKSSYDFSWLLRKSECKIINECGSRDIPLLVSKLFVINTGMAGRVGFKGSNNSRFMNRYYDFGHSDYFNPDNNFMFSNWLPLFEENYAPEYIDCRTPSILHDVFLNRAITTLSMLKLLYHPLSLVIISLFILL